MSTATASPILVTGGTGTLGRSVVPRLRDAGRRVRVLSRRSPEAGWGVEPATGRPAVRREIEARGEGPRSSTVLQQVGDEEKALSLVGRRRGPGRGTWCTSRSSAPTGSRSSAASTARCSATSRPSWPPSAWSPSSASRDETLRATQFHDLTLMTARRMAKLPVMPVPAGFGPTIDAGEVAARPVELALGAPAGPVLDMAGPQVYGMDEPSAATCGPVTSAGRRRSGSPARPRRDQAGANLAPRPRGRRTWRGSWQTG